MAVNRIPMFDASAGARLRNNQSMRRSRCSWTSIFNQVRHFEERAPRSAQFGGCSGGLS